MKTVAIGILTIMVLVVNDVKCKMTEAQVQSAARMMRNVCQPKTKVTNAEIDSMHKGEFTDNRDMKCYMECILRMAQIMKDAKITMESVEAQLANLPSHIAETAKAALEPCKNIVKSTEKCEAAYEFYKCFYEANPSDFFLP